MITYSRLRRRSGGQAHLPARMHVVTGEPGPGVEFHQNRRDRHAGQHRAELGAQRLGVGRDVLGGQRRDDQLPVLAEPHLAGPAVPGELGLQVRQRGVRLVGRQRQGVGGRGRLADQVAELQPPRLPLLGGEQERRRVGVAARPGHVDVSRAEPVAQRHQHAQLPVVPERGDVARLPRGLQVPGPPGGHEAVRSPVGDLAGPGRVQSGEDRDGVQQAVHAGAAVEPDGGQHSRHELAQVRHRGVHHRQVPVIARQPRPAGLPRGPHPPPRSPPGRAPARSRHARADQPGRRQVLARLPEQQLRGVVLHRPREQELLQVLPPRRIDLPPAEVSGHLPQMTRPGLPARPVAAQLADRDAQPLRQPGRRGGRGRGHVVRDGPEPRQRAQLDSHAEHVLLPPELPHERLVRRREREVPDQLRPLRLREPPQLRQLIR